MTAFWKLMMISRAIGYQEKKVKHRTAPARNPYAEALRLTLRPNWPAASCLVAVGIALALRRVATCAIKSPVTCGRPPEWNCVLGLAWGPATQLAPTLSRCGELSRRYSPRWR